MPNEKIIINNGPAANSAGRKHPRKRRKNRKPNKRSVPKSNFRRVRRRRTQRRGSAHGMRFKIFTPVKSFNVADKLTAEHLIYCQPISPYMRSNIGVNVNTPFSTELSKWKKYRFNKISAKLVCMHDSTVAGFTVTMAGTTDGDQPTQDLTETTCQ